jgi:hypothetical protein
VILTAPQPVSPIGNVQVSTLQPTLTANNAGRSGPAGALTYRFEISDDSGFGSLADTFEVNEQGGATEGRIGVALQTARTYFWRVRAEDPSTVGPWSSTESFRTPAAPSPGGSAPPSIAPGGKPSPSDGIAVVAWVKEDLIRRGISIDGDCGGFAITRRVAWQLRNNGAGTERKPAGRNCEGHSIDILIFPGGQTVDILIGAGADNGPTWQEHGILPDWPDWWVAPTNPD